MVFCFNSNEVKALKKVRAVKITKGYKPLISAMIELDIVKNLLTKMQMPKTVELYLMGKYMVVAT